MIQDFLKFPSVKSTITQEEVDEMLKCTHQNITFYGYTMEGIDLSNRDLKGIFFAGILMDNVTFSGSNCQGASFEYTIMNNINFTGADLRNTIFKEAVISSTKFTDIKASIWKKIYLHLKNF